MCKELRGGRLGGAGGKNQRKSDLAAARAAGLSVPKSRVGGAKRRVAAAGKKRK